MPRILILYGTTDGHTAKVAARLSDTLRSRGADTDVVNVAHARPRPAGYDGVLVASSVHTGTWSRRARGQLTAETAVGAGGSSTCT